MLYDLINMQIDPSKRKYFLIEYTLNKLIRIFI